MYVARLGHGRLPKRLSSGRSFSVARAVGLMSRLAAVVCPRWPFASGGLTNGAAVTVRAEDPRPAAIARWVGPCRRAAQIRTAAFCPCQDDLHCWHPVPGYSRDRYSAARLRSAPTAWNIMVSLLGAQPFPNGPRVVHADRADPDHRHPHPLPPLDGPLRPAKFSRRDIPRLETIGYRSHRAMHRRILARFCARASCSRTRGATPALADEKTGRLVMVTPRCPVGTSTGRRSAQAAAMADRLVIKTCDGYRLCRRPKTAAGLASGCEGPQVLSASGPERAAAA